MLENLSGNFRIDKVSLTLDTAGGALMHPAPGQTLSLGAISAVIPNMELNSVLQVTGNSSGPVPAYLALVANSPLGKLLDGALDEAQGTGDWRMPIADGAAAQYRRHAGGRPYPVRRQQLLLHAGNAAVDADARRPGVFREGRADLRGPRQFLGGPVKISGRLAQSGDALNFEGTLAGAGLTQISNAASMSRFSGKAAYKGKLSYQKGGAVEISGESDLAGWRSTCRRRLASPRSPRSC